MEKPFDLEESFLIFDFLLFNFYTYDKELFQTGFPQPWQE